MFSKILGKLRTMKSIIINDGVSNGINYMLARYMGLQTARYNGWVIPDAQFIYNFFLYERETNIKNYVINRKPCSFIVAGAWPCDYIALATDLGLKMILGFEPFPDNYMYCMRFLGINKHKFERIYKDKSSVIAYRDNQKIIVLRKALYHNKGVYKMDYCGSNPAMACIKNNGYVEVETDTLNNYMKYIKPPCIVLLDTEGTELEVLTGSVMLWNKCEFIIEVWSRDIEKTRQYLNRHGFKYHIVEKDWNTYYWLIQHSTMYA